MSSFIGGELEEPVSVAEMAGELVGALRRAGTELIYGVPGGGSNLDVVGAAGAAGIRFVLTHGETAATIMAAVTAELTGCPSAAVVTRGPGAASAVNGAAQALLDRQPLLLVTDCVNAVERGRISHQRLDHPGLLGPVTKATVTLGSRRAGAAAATAVALATSGRPGPVHVDLDPTVSSSSPTPAGPPGSDSSSDISAVRELLRRSRRPVIIAGVGAVALPRAQRDATLFALRRFASAGNVPVLTTYKGRGLVPDGSPADAGVATGATIEFDALSGADLVIGVGLDPVELIPGTWPYRAPVALLGRWPVDDSSYFGDRLVAEACGEISAVLDDLAMELRTDWLEATGGNLGQAARRKILAATSSKGAGLTPQEVVTEARLLSPAGTIATVDAGAHMLPAVPLWSVEQPGELLISSGLATMGFALPAAVAAALVRPERRVICLTGDGGLGMALAELETAVRLELKITVVVFNDAKLSLIAIKQRAQDQGGEGAVSYGPTDYASIAVGVGMASFRVADLAAYRRALSTALASDGPVLIDVAVDPSGYRDILEAIRGDRSRN